MLRLAVDLVGDDERVVAETGGALIHTLQEASTGTSRLVRSAAPGKRSGTRFSPQDSIWLSNSTLRRTSRAMRTSRPRPGRSAEYRTTARLLNRMLGCGISVMLAPKFRAI